MARSLYPQILVDGWKCVETEGSKILVNVPNKTIYVGATSKDEDLILNLVIALHGKGSYKRAIFGNNFDGVLSRATAYQYARVEHGVRVFDSKYVNDDRPEAKMAHALINDIPEDELRSKGITEEEIALYSRIKDIMLPVNGGLPPFTRLKTAAFVLDSLYKDKRDKAESGDSQPSQDSKKEKSKKEESKKEESKKEESKKEDPKKEESKKEESKKEDPKKEESKKEDPKKEESKKEDPKKEESKKEEPKKEEPKWDGTPYDKYKEYLSKATPAPPKKEEKKAEPKTRVFNPDAIDGPVTYTDFKDSDTQDAEHRGLTKPLPTNYAEEIYANMRIVYPTLNAYNTGMAFKSKTSSDSGIIPSRFHDPASGRYFTSRGKSLGFSRGGTILVDVSGSTCFYNNHVVSLIDNFPLATIAVYSGPLREDSKSGGLVVVACNGKYVANLDIKKYFRSSCNMVDGPAINWLSLQRAPRIFVSDLGFTNRFDYPLDMRGPLFQKTLDTLLNCRATILHDRTIARKFMSEGTMSLENWNHNNSDLREITKRRYIPDDTFKKTVVKMTP